MLPDWNELSNGVQIALAHEALRLFAAMLRAEDEDGLTPAGHADDSGAWQGRG